MDPFGPHGVIFDLDGTIADSEEHKCAAHEAAVKACGGTWDGRAYRRLMGRTRDFTAALMSACNVRVRREAYREAYNLEKYRRADKAVLYPWARQAFAFCGVSAVASAIFTAGWTGVGVREFLLRNRCSHPCDIFGSDSLLSKEEPESFRTVAGRMGVKPENTLVIDDGLLHLRAAQQAGCKILIATHDYCDSITRELPDAPAFHVEAVHSIDLRKLLCAA